ncbi:hypothetical protein NP233_g2641 [Leucocoprinus birnbaumii]|uniref:F-box domain-containing protein n=1 Tax=Leucocoprinus birnbaumii TaxID=56174 RepID=A0AAD5YX47_9AGAR|nr:hypothetical protein NP233_g2641 [Leucocoprinus birnbaumii]
MARHNTMSNPRPIRNNRKGQLSSNSTTKTPSPPSYIENLPDEILDSVFEYTVLGYQNDYRIRATLRRVCKRWNTVVVGNPGLWTKISVGVSVAAISELESPGMHNDSENNATRRKGIQSGRGRGLGGTITTSKVQSFVENGGYDRAAAGCTRSGLGSMPPLEFVQKLLTRSGELKVSLGMTVYDLDAETVRPVPVVEADEEEEYGRAESATQRGVHSPAAPGYTRNARVTDVNLDAEKRLVEYSHGVVELLAAHISRCTDFHLYFVSEHTAVVPSASPTTSFSFASLVATLPLHRGYNLRNVSITSHLIPQANSHFSTHTANHTIFNTLVCRLPASVRRLHWQGNTPHIDFTLFPGLSNLRHVDFRGRLESEGVFEIFKRAKSARTIRLHVDTIHAGLIQRPPSQCSIIENLEGLTIESGCEVFQVLGTCVKMPRLGICCIEVPRQVPKSFWQETPNPNGAANNGVTIRNAWEWLCIFLHRCPKLKVLQLYDPYGAIPIDIIKDLVCAVKDAAACFIVTPGAEWLQRPEVDEVFWEQLREIKHPREDDITVTTLKDEDSLSWVSVGWFVEPCAEEWLRSEEWINDTGFRWDILDEY